MDGYDLAFAVPGQHIGTAPAALARSSGLPARFRPKVKPYHRFPEHSTVPLPLLQELTDSRFTDDNG